MVHSPSAPPLADINNDERSFTLQQQHVEADQLPMAGSTNVNQVSKDLPPSYESLFPER